MPFSDTAAPSSTEREPSAPGIHLQLLPDWTPSRRPQLARFRALVKVASGAVLEAPARIDLRLMDEAERLVDVSTAAVGPTEGDVAGPAWRCISGRLVEVDDTVTQAEGVLAGVRSERVCRGDARRPLMLTPVAYQVGLPGEPHLWWRFYNRGAAPIPVGQIQRSAVLWLDGRELRPPPTAYDGPALLSPERALSGLWSLDDLDRMARRGRHRLQLGMLGERSDEIELAWSPDSASAER